MTTAKNLPAIGAPFAGGFYAGQFRIGEQAYALIAAPKDEGEHTDTAWNDGRDAVEGATSYNDGLANTEAMATAGIDLASWARGLRIAGNDDWYLPSQDELELCYRNLKPTSNENYPYGRSGINVSALPPTYPYSETNPAQTGVTAFQECGEQAFDGAWYWTSTQHAAYAYCAWCQHFGNGNQRDDRKVSELRARAVRRLPI